MLHLDEILQKPMSAEAFLASQRERFARLFKEDVDALLADYQTEDGRAEVVKYGDFALADMYILPGTGGQRVHVGTPPAWKECRSENPEYLWGLARMSGLYDLTRAYLVTGEEKYGKKAMEYVENFITTCPALPIEYAKDIPGYLSYAFSAGTTNPWRQLEVGERMSDSWKAFYTRMLFSPLMTPEFHAMFACSVYEHEKQLRYISPMLWPNGAHNHYLFENCGLLTATLLFPDFKNREEWLTFAIRELERCSEKQIMEDGAQLEGCPGYHAQCVTSFVNLISLAKRYGVTFSEAFYDRIATAISYQAWTYKPTGGCAPLGDSCQVDYGLPTVAANYFNGRGKLDDFAKMVLLMRRPNAKLLPEKDYLLARETAETAKGGVHQFPSVGQIIGRTGYTPADSYFSLMCHTPVFNGHMHCDPLSVELTLNGKDVLIDPSLYGYTENETRKMYKSAYYHSCLTFGGKEPFDYLSTWTYTPQKPGSTTKTYEGDGFVGGDGSHENYEPNEHKRLALLLGKDTFAVVDHVKNDTGATVELNFHLDHVGYTLTKTGAEKETMRLLGATDTFELLEAEQSPRWDVSEPSTRFVAHDGGFVGTKCYVTVFTEDKTLLGAAAVIDGEQVKITFTYTDKVETFLWAYGETLKKM